MPNRLIALAGLFAIWALGAVGAVALWGSYSPDSYGYWLLGDALANGRGYEPQSLRDFWLPGESWSSRSFPPLWPVFLAGLSVVKGSLESATVLNLGIAAGLAALCTLWAHQTKSWIAFAVFGLVLIDARFIEEVVAARAMPLAFLMGLTGLLLVQSNRRSSLFMAGLALGLAMLARFDMLALAAAASLGIWVTSAPQHRLKSVSTFLGGLLLALGPWVLRNWLEFHSPLMSDNTVTALSLYRGNAAQAYWDTLPEFSGVQWLSQRAQYLVIGLASLFGKFSWSIPTACAIGLGVAAWPKLEQPQQRLLLSVGLATTLGLCLLALTPYTDERYFLIYGLYAGITLGSLGLEKRLPSSRQSTVLLVSVLLVCGLSTTLAGYHKVRTTAQSWSFATKGQTAAAWVKSLALPAGRIGADNAEALAYYVGPGYLTVQRPNNLTPQDEAYWRWARRFKLDYVLLNASEVPVAQAAQVIATSPEHNLALLRPL